MTRELAVYNVIYNFREHISYRAYEDINISYGLLIRMTLQEGYKRGRLIINESIASTVIDDINKEFGK